MNGDDELTNRVLRQLDRMVASQGEIKAEQVRQSMCIEALTVQVAKANGRTGTLEAKETARTIREARAESAAEAVATLKKRQVALLVAAVTVGASVIGTAASIITRLLA